MLMLMLLLLDEARLEGDDLKKMWCNYYDFKVHNWSRCSHEKIHNPGSWVNRPFKAETVLFLRRAGVNNERILLSAG